MDKFFYARRSRTENSGWRLDAFKHRDEKAQKERIGYLDVEMRARRVVVDYCNTRSEYKGMGVYSAMKSVFSAHISAFGGKFCRGLTGELSAEGEAVALKRDTEQEALRKLFLRLNSMRSGDVRDPSVEITPMDEHLWPALCNVSYP